MIVHVRSSRMLMVEWMLKSCFDLEHVIRTFVFPIRILAPQVEAPPAKKARGQPAAVNLAAPSKPVSRWSDSSLAQRSLSWVRNLIWT